MKNLTSDNSILEDVNVCQNELDEYEMRLMEGGNFIMGGHFTLFIADKYRGCLKERAGLGVGCDDKLVLHSEEFLSLDRMDECELRLFATIEPLFVERGLTFHQRSRVLSQWLQAIKEAILEERIEDGYVARIAPYFAAQYFERYLIELVDLKNTYEQGTKWYFERLDEIVEIAEYDMHRHFQLDKSKSDLERNNKISENSLACAVVKSLNKRTQRVEFPHHQDEQLGQLDETKYCKKLPQ